MVEVPTVNEVYAHIKANLVTPRDATARLLYIFQQQDQHGTSLKDAMAKWDLDQADESDRQLAISRANAMYVQWAMEH
jgi:hypothetical protein